MKECPIEVSIDKPDIFNPYEQLDLFKTISLETSKECLIGEIDKLIINEDDNIIIFDQRNSNILLFDSIGNFIRRIGTKGHGSDEYLEFSDIAYDKETRTIYAFERFCEQMYVFDLNGELKQRISSNFNFNSFVKNEYGFWIYSCYSKNNPNKSLLMLVDESLTEIKKEYFQQKNINNVQFTSRFTENINNGKQYFYYDGSNNIWELSNSATECFYVDFGKYTLPYELIAEAENLEECDQIMQKTNYCGFIDNLNISNSHVSFNCRKGGLNKPVESYAVTHSLLDKSTKTFSSIKMKRDSLPINYHRLLGIDKGGRFIYLIEPQKLFDNEFRSLKKHMPNVAEDNNPIIVLMKSA